MADELKEVFISYHEKSAGKLAAKLADALESAGISCWYAKRDLPSGGDFADYIPQQIDGCKVFLLILNEGANTSRHIESEVGLAFRRYNRGEKIAIVPYQAETCRLARWLDYYLVHIQILSAETTNFSALTTEIAHKLGREPAKNGNCGPFARWILQTGTLTISTFRYVQNGKISKHSTMGDFYYQNVPEGVNTPWWNDHEKINSIIIEQGITSIGNFTFYGCVNLIDVTIPDSVASIGSCAFRNCSNLTNIIIPNSVDSIGFLAFNNCATLSSVVIPYGVINISSGTFEDCFNLTSVTIPNSITSIGHHAFYGCVSLSNVTIPYSVTDIEHLAFYDCLNLTRVSVPANAKIADNAFDPHTEVIRRPVDRFYSAENQAVLRQSIEEYESGRAALIPKTPEELKAME